MKYIIALTALLTVVLLILLNLRGCDSDGWRSIQAGLLRVDTVRVILPAPPPVRDTVRGDTVIVYREHVVRDSALLDHARRIQQRYDSLKAVLAQYAERMVFSTEDIVPSTGDTLRIECNELDRSIMYSLRYAQRRATFSRPLLELPTGEQTIHQGFGVGACLGAGLNTEGQFRATLSIGILYGYFIQ